LFEQTFRKIDDILHKDAGCGSELDYIEQTSWIRFLKYLCPEKIYPAQGFFVGTMRTIDPDAHVNPATMIKYHAKESFIWLFILLVLTGLGLVSLPVLSTAVTVGEECGGGVVVYVDASRKHGLIAARSDMKGHSSGSPKGLFTWDDAQAACRNYVSCDYHDWVLPSKEQLNRLYLQKSVLERFSFSYNYYWSSTEDSAGHVWVQGFGAGFQVRNFKTNSNRVRAVRVF
jgi:hypothetical protein